MSFSTKSKISELGFGYSCEVDTVDEREWGRILDQFDDANIYQTWSYDEVRFGRKSISHLLLKKDNHVVAAAQSRIVKLPLVGAGVAYVRWGPLWRHQDSEPDLEIFRQGIRALRNEYACRRGLVLRVYPSIFRNDSPRIEEFLGAEGFSISKRSPDRTLVLDLNRTLEDLRTGLNPHWRRELKVAEKNKLEIIEGSDDDTFEAFIKVYKEMVSRKAFVEPNDINEFRFIQNRLPERFKMKVMLSKSGCEVTSGAIFSTIGKSALYLFGATSNAGLKSRGSFLLHWKFIEWLKNNGFATYDLNGINPITNPGTYRFKSDLCGSNGRDAYFLGRFDSCSNLLSYSCVAFGDALRAKAWDRKKKAKDRGRRAGTSSAILTPRAE